MTVNGKLQVHRPSQDSEKERIQKDGGKVGRNEEEAKADDDVKAKAKGRENIKFNVNTKARWRVFPEGITGGVALSRVLGGRPLKEADPKLVIAEPGYNDYKITGDEEFLVVASDGLWDFVKKTEDVADVVRNAWKDGSAPANALDRKAIDMGSDDNVSTCVYLFPKNGATPVSPSPSRTARSRREQ